MGGAEVSIRGQKVSIAGTADVNVTDRVARILGQLTDGVNVIDPRQIRSLAFITDSVDVSGSLVSISGTPDINVTDRVARILGQLTDGINVIDPRQIRSLAFITDSVDVSGSLVSISGTPDVNVTDRAIRLLGITYGSQGAQLQQKLGTLELLVQLRNAGIDIDPTQIRHLTFATDSVNVSGSTITVTNVPSTPINDFNTGLNVASGSSSTHTYTATGNFKLTSIQASASGAMKIEVKAGTSGSETTKMVAFITESNLTIQLEFHEEIQITIGQRIQVIRTNREEEAMDVFSTILGFNN